MGNQIEFLYFIMSSFCLIYFWFQIRKPDAIFINICLSCTQGVMNLDVKVEQRSNRKFCVEFWPCVNGAERNTQFSFNFAKIYQQYTEYEQKIQKRRLSVSAGCQNCFQAMTVKWGFRHFSSYFQSLLHNFLS